MDNGGCTHYCQDSPFSYTCSCEEGFTLNEDKHTCSGMYSVCLSLTTPVYYTKDLDSVENFLFLTNSQILMNVPLLVMDVIKTVLILRDRISVNVRRGML